MSIAYLCRRFNDLIVANQGAAVIEPFGIIEIPVSATDLDFAIARKSPLPSRNGVGQIYTPPSIPKKLPGPGS